MLGRYDMDGAQLGEKSGEVERAGARQIPGGSETGSGPRAEMGPGPIGVVGPSFPRRGMCRFRVREGVTGEARL